MIKRIIKDFKLSAGEYKELSCTAPCSLVSVLTERGIIPPIHTSDNIMHLSGLPGQCEFVSCVDLDANAASMKHAFLKLDGIVANAEVLFNGKSYGFMKNPDREFVFDVTDGVRAGENTLCIRAISPLPEVAPINDDGIIEPYIPDMGIVGKCTLLASDHPIIDNVHVIQRREGEKVVLGITVDTLGESADMRAVATLVSPVGRLYFAGISGGAGTLIISSPEPWMPNGHGSQSLYKLTVTLYNGDEAEDSAELKIGVRTVSFDNDILTVDGVRIPAKGASYVRDDLAVPIPKRDRAERLVSAMAACHMNALRIYDLGIHPDEHVYELCDKYGIAVIQQISLTYTPQSSISAYSRRLKSEIPRMLDVLARHPSVCAVSFLPVYDKAGARPDGDGLIKEFIDSCKRVIEPIMADYKTSFVALDKDSEYAHRMEGDSQVSLPALKTVAAFAEPRDMNLLSPVMEAHTDNYTDVPKMLSALCDRLRYAGSLSSLIYSSQLASALDMKERALAVRAGRSGSMCAVFDRFNDSRPVISSSFVDSFGRYKAPYYLAKRFFAPVALGARAEGTKIIFSLSNETSKPYSGMINYALYDDTDKCILESKRPALCNAMSACDVFEEDFSHYLKLGAEHYYIIYDIFDGKSTSDKESVLFCAPKRFAFREPDIRCEIRGSGRNYEIVLSSSAFAMAVCVDFEDIDAEFSDNFVDVHEDYPVKLTFRTDSVTTVEHLRSVVKIISVYDIQA